MSVVGLVLGMGSLALAQDAAKPAAQPTPSTPKAPAVAPEPKPEPSLRAGMPAPEFKVEKFLKGTPFTGFEKGRVYVIEFWATWCGPCVMSMPHLSQLQREYAEKGVTICGVNIWEDKNYNDETLAKATKFVEGKGDGMAYTVAYDGGSKHMDTAWMTAAARRGIPSAFVVDQAGKIAWIGHPMSLDMVLDEVVKGTWDVAKGPEKLEAANKAFSDAAEKYKESISAGDAAWDAATKQYPLMGHTRAADRFGAMLEGGHAKEACKLGEELVEQAKKDKNAGPIMEVLGTLSNPSVLTTPEAKQLLMKAAQANFEFADKSQPGAWVSMARAYFFSGETEKGREAGKKAMELAPAEVRSRMEAYLKQIEDSAAAK
jgi:thiol-disulfide isomerase/thioredoxin